MNVDSQITMRVINAFMAHGTPVLSIHDSYIVPYGKEELLESEMTNAFAVVTGIERVKLKAGTEKHSEKFDRLRSQHDQLKWQFGYRNEGFIVESEMATIKEIPRTQGYKRRLAQFKQWQQNQSKHT
jgi:hypothetical protein